MQTWNRPANCCVGSCWPKLKKAKSLGREGTPSRFFFVLEYCSPPPFDALMSRWGLSVIVFYGSCRNSNPEQAFSPRLLRPLRHRVRAGGSRSLVF